MGNDYDNWEGDDDDEWEYYWDHDDSDDPEDVFGYHGPLKISRGEATLLDISHPSNARYIRAVPRGSRIGKPSRGEAFGAGVTHRGGASAGQGTTNPENGETHDYW